MKLWNQVVRLNHCVFCPASTQNLPLCVLMIDVGGDVDVDFGVVDDDDDDDDDDGDGDDSVVDDDDDDDDDDGPEVTQMMRMIRMTRTQKK